MPLFIAGAAVLSAGVGYAASSGAANRAAESSQRATDASAAVQNRALDIQQSNTAQARETGDASLRALSQRLGLTPAQTPGASPGVPVSAAQGGGFDPNAYGAMNADLGQYYNANAGNRDFVARFPTPTAFYDWHYNQGGGRDEIAAGTRAPLQSAQAPPPTAAEPIPAATPTPTPTTPAIVDEQGSYTVERPAIPDAPTYTPPTYRETAIAPLDVGLDKYTKSPDYEFQQSEGNRNILANAAATGALESGAALKALQKFGQDLAMGDYGQWRDYTTGQYNQDRGFTANRDDAANAFAGAQAQNTFNAATGAYQYKNSLAQGAYDADRGYATNRYDTRTNNLLSLAGYGQNASNASSNAVGQNANALSNLYLTNASTQGNAGMASAGQLNQSLGTGVNALAYYYGNKTPSGGGSSLSGLEGLY